MKIPFIYWKFKWFLGGKDSVSIKTDEAMVQVNEHLVNNELARCFEFELSFSNKDFETSQEESWTPIGFALELARAYCRTKPDAYLGNINVLAYKDFVRYVSQLELDYLLSNLDRHYGSVTSIARAIKVNRKSVYNLVGKNARRFGVGLFVKYFPSVAPSRILEWGLRRHRHNVEKKRQHSVFKKPSNAKKNNDHS